MTPLKATSATALKPSTGWRSTLLGLWVHDKALDSIKVAAALAGVLLLCRITDHDDWMIGLVLGVIASALAETEDRISGRMRALGVTLLCFAIAAVSVRLLFPYPVGFALGLAISTFGFVMLGAIGERYATIAFASLILAVYCMLVAYARHVTQSHLQDMWFEPSVLLAGAAWYGIVSILAASLFATRPVRRSLASLFAQLAHYLELKARLLEPVEGRDIESMRRALAVRNAALVGEFNRCRDVLIRWVQDGPLNRRGERFLKWYFLAQDIHERASSSHQPYEHLAQAFARSDILFRSQHLMQGQATSCRALGESILRDEHFRYPAESQRSLQALQAAREFVAASENAQWQAHRESIDDLYRNIARIENELSCAGDPDALPMDPDATLRDGSPRSLNDMLLRLRMEFTPRAARFRHGIRLSFALSAGYALLHAFNLPQGYWVLLTTLFVSQPTYSGTWRRLAQRLGGTLIGLIAAWAFIALFPQPGAQLALAIVAGVAFFALRQDRYTFATACITVLVFACFNQIGNSYTLLWPRLLDTFIGAMLAALAVVSILPDWQGRKLHRVMSDTIEKTRLYLTEVLHQYDDGKRDDLPYRIARREAHNADADLSRTIAAMLDEPDRRRIAPELAFDFLNVSHSLLAYTSALGAHREKIDTWHDRNIVAELARRIDRALSKLVQSIPQHGSAPHLQRPEVAPTSMPEQDPLASPTERRLLRLLRLIDDATTELERIAAEFPPQPQD